MVGAPQIVLATWAMMALSRLIVYLGGLELVQVCTVYFVYL